MKSLPSACVAASFALSPAALAYRAGPPAGKTGSPQSMGHTCRDCHGSASGSGSVQVLGAPARYRANQVYDLTVRIADPVQAGAGFEISAENAAGHVGTLIVSDPANTGHAEGVPQQAYVCHSFNGVANAVANWQAMGHAAEYHLQWRAPAGDAGTITFYAAGNAINNNLNNTGDIIYLTQVSTAFAGCVADLDGDGQVTSSDLAILLGSWGGTGAADLDGGGVGASDLALLLGAWGTCP